MGLCVVAHFEWPTLPLPDPRPVQVGDFGIGSVLNGECKAMRCWQTGQKIAKGVRYLHYDQARRHPWSMDALEIMEEMVPLVDQPAA
eukprot:COSAG06_NODE_34905_length_467_cov_1.600543_2_plen_87_part_00